MALGFLWSMNEVEWEAQFQALVGFKEKHGHCNVPSTYLENPPLGRWVIRQRSARVAGKLWLSTERVARRRSFGVSVGCLRRYLGSTVSRTRCVQGANTGHCNVPVLDPNNPRLGKWLHKQRQKRKRGAMSADVAAGVPPPTRRVRRRVGFPRLSWGERFEQLVAFKEKYGHCNPSTESDPDSGALGIWLVWQNARHGERKLSPRQTVAPPGVGPDLGWHRRPMGEAISSISRVQKETRALQGSKRLFGGYPPKLPKRPQRTRFLGLWLQRQQMEKSRGTVSATPAARLTSKGVEWNAVEALWARQWKALV